MMVRAMRLREVIDRFCSTEYSARVFALTELEWKQIGYLIDIVRPFNFFTTSVGKTKGVTLPYGLAIYDELYERLTESRRRLKAKVQSYPWVNTLIEGIDAAEAKLDIYYNKMYSDIGSFYALGAILNPNTKLKAFDPDFCWLDFKAKDWQFEFEDQFRELYRQSYRQDSSSAERLRVIRQVNMDPLALMLNRSRYTRDIRRQSSDGVNEEENEDEVDRWLRMSTYCFYTNLYTNL
jgi:hypothetical protein